MKDVQTYYPLTQIFTTVTKSWQDSKMGDTEVSPNSSGEVPPLYPKNGLGQGHFGRNSIKTGVTNSNAS